MRTYIAKYKNRKKKQKRKGHRKKKTKGKKIPPEVLEPTAFMLSSLLQIITFSMTEWKHRKRKQNEFIFIDSFPLILSYQGFNKAMSVVAVI